MDERPEEFAARSFQFACQIVRLYQHLMKIPGFPFQMARQLLRSGTSIGSNLEEAKAPHSRKDLRSKFTIALKESRETKYWLRLILATKLAGGRIVEDALQEADEFVAMLTVSVRNLKQG